MNKEKRIMTNEERLALNERLAKSYIAAYDKTRLKSGTSVKDGATWDDWKFAENAEYWSPYFGNGTINLSENPMSVEDSATMEALSYSIEFEGWSPVDFECWPTINGCAWKSHFGGKRKIDGKFMDFFVYSFLRTNEFGEITHWETHVSCEYNDFLEAAIGSHGPYKNGADEYMAAVMKKLASAGIDIRTLMHK